MHYDSYKENCLLGIDATSSVYQIIGGLIKNEKMLLNTNCIDNDAEKKNDIYSTVMENFNQKFDLKRAEEGYSEGLTKHIALLKLKEKPYQLYIENFETIMNKFNQKKRALFKATTMTYAYNQSVYSRYQEIGAELLLDKNPYSLNCYTKFLLYLTESIIAALNQDYPDLERLKKLIQSIVKLNDNNRLIFKNHAQTSHEVIELYPKHLIKTYKFYNRFNKKNTSVYEKFTHPSDINIRKHMIATMPNYIHYLDSCLLIDVLNKCIENQIECIPIHDCFYTKPCHMESIRKFYTESFIDIIIKPNNLEHLIRDNSL